MARVLWLATMAALVAALFMMTAPRVGVSAFGLLTPTPTRTVTATPCPMATPEWLRVEPVTSPTDLLEQTIEIELNNGDVVTVTLESGIYSAEGNRFFDVPVGLLPNTTHHLMVQGHVRRIVQPGGCVYGDYTISTTIDRNNNPLIIEQVSGAYPHYLPLVLTRP